MTAYYCIGPDEYVRFDDDFVANAVAKLDHAAAPDVPDAPPHSPGLRLRVSPNAPHELEFPTLKRIKGTSHYLETGRYFSWRKLHERNSISVDEPPALSENVIARWLAAPSQNGVEPEDAEGDLDGTEEDDASRDGEKKGKTRAKGSRIRGSKKLAKARRLNETGANGQLSSSPSSVDSMSAGPSPAARPLSHSNLAPPPPSSTAAPPSLLSRISPAPQTQRPSTSPTNTPAVEVTEAAPRTFNIKGLAAARSARPSSEAPAPAPTASSPAASPSKAAKTRPLPGPLPSSLPMRPPAELSLTPTPISSRPPSPPPDPSSGDAARKLSPPGASSSLALPSSSDMGRSQSLNQINALLARLKRREFPNQHPPSRSSAANGTAMTDEEWGAGGMRASSRTVSREGSRAPSPGPGERSRIHPHNYVEAVEPPALEKEVPPHMRDRRETPRSPPKPVDPAPDPPPISPPSTSLAAPPPPSTVAASTSPTSSTGSPPPPDKKLDWASLDDDDEELPDLTDWGIPSSALEADPDVDEVEPVSLPPISSLSIHSTSTPTPPTSTTGRSRGSWRGRGGGGGGASGRNPSGPSMGRSLYVPPASRLASGPSSSSASSSQAGHHQPRRGGASGPVEGGKGGRGRAGPGPPAALFGKLAKGALGADESGLRRTTGEGTGRGRGGKRTASSGGGGGGGGGGGRGKGK